MKTKKQPKVVVATKTQKQGRPTLAETRSEQIHVRCTRDEFNLWHDMAEVSKRPVSQWAEMMLNAAIHANIKIR